MTVVDIRLQSTKLENNPNTKEAANVRQEKLEKDVAEYLANGGEVESLPAYDELEDVRPVSKCSYGTGVEVIK
jgi:hypothetical protein